MAGDAAYKGDTLQPRHSYFEYFPLFRKNYLVHPLVLSLYRKLSMEYFSNFSLNSFISVEGNKVIEIAAGFRACLWKMSSSLCKHHKRRVTDVHLICINMFENRKKRFGRGALRNWTKNNNIFTDFWIQHVILELRSWVQSMQYSNADVFCWDSEFEKSFALWYSKNSVLEFVWQLFTSNTQPWTVSFPV